MSGSGRTWPRHTRSARNPEAERPASHLAGRLFRAHARQLHQVAVAADAQEVAPDLLAEILSPDDAPAEVLAKVADWLAAGTRLVWLVDPQRSEVRIYRQDGSLSVLLENDSLEGENVLPGFTCPLIDVFSWHRRGGA